jgi:GNAT superfamily N-acetyltransferase
MEAYSSFPQGLNIERFTTEDLQAVPGLRPEGWGDMSAVFHFYLSEPRCYTVKAIMDEKIVGTGTAIIHDNVAWIAGIITIPEYWNRGIGKAVTEHVTRYAQEHVASVSLIATKYGFPIYEKMGYREDGDYLFFHPNKIKLSPPKGLVLYTPEFHEAVLELDKIITGENRSWLLNQHLDKAFLYVRKNELLGFTIPSWGEGLTLAIEEEAGLTLMQLNLQQEKGIALPTANKAAVQFALKNGFQIDDSRLGKKMYLNQYLPWRPYHVYGRIGGNLG